MKTVYLIVKGSLEAKSLAALLINRSKWFSVTPEPDDYWMFRAKNEPGLPDRAYLRAAGIVDDDWTPRGQPMSDQHAHAYGCPCRQCADMMKAICARDADGEPAFSDDELLEISESRNEPPPAGWEVEE